jgi:hypothetical protein
MTGMTGADGATGLTGLTGMTGMTGADDAFYAINEQLMIDLAAYVKGCATA